jgi:hypothetical protein
MRRFILITALVLASAAAQAQPSRGLTLASADDSSERIETVKPAEAAKPEAAKPQATAPEAAKPEASKPDTDKPTKADAKPAKSRRHYEGYAGDEAKARRIAARYGISW